MRTKPIVSAQEAAARVNRGDVLLAGGFGMTGNPVNLLHALADLGTGDLTYVGNNVGEQGLGGGKLLRNGQLSKVVGSFFTSNPDVVEAVQAGGIEVELIPQGSLAEALRAGGAGIAAFYTPTAAGTVIAENQEARRFGDRDHVLVRGIRGNVAFLRAHMADRAGNLVYRMTEQNFNKAMATAADLVIAEVDRVVEIGEIPPEHVHTPGNLVDALVIASVTAEQLGTSASVDSTAGRHNAGRMAMARRALRELEPGNVVNLGIGIPTLVGELIEPRHQVVIHTENGMLGVGPAPQAGGARDFPVNAGKAPVTALPGASYFDSAESFALIRGGHVDVAIMGALQVDSHGSLANWAVPGGNQLGVGGAMDLAVGARRLIIVMTHTDRHGRPKLVETCTLPLTAKGVVDMVITDLGVFSFPDGHLTLLELQPGASLSQVKETTAANFRIAESVIPVAPDTATGSRE